MLDKFMSAINRGPPTAVVRKVDVRRVDVDGSFDSFEVRY